MTGARYPVSPEDPVWFTITGETARRNLPEIQAMLGQVSASLRVEQTPLVSPSVLIDILPQPNGAAIFAITEGSIESYFTETGMHPRATMREAGLYFDSLVWHLREGHTGRDGKCKCPLEPVKGIDNVWRTYSCVGIDPVSFTHFANQEEGQIIESMSLYGNILLRVGQRRAEVLKQMRQRLVEDLQIEAGDSLVD